MLHFREHDDYYEFHYPVKISVRLLNDENPEVHKYKYHVESPATEDDLIKSVEFIVGPNTSGGIIDRFLKIHCNSSQLKVGCKFLSLNMKVCNMYTNMHLADIDQNKSDTADQADDHCSP